MNANLKAAELKIKLFKLLTEYKDFALAIHTAKAANPDSQLEAHGQADQVACKLADVYDRMGHELDLFFDASRDEGDQTFSFPV